MNTMAKIEIEFPAGCIDSKSFLLVARDVRKLVELTTGMKNITTAEYEEPKF